VATARITLSKPEYDALKELSQRTGKSEQRLLHDAVEQLLARSNHRDRLALLRKAKGIWKDRQDLPDAAALRAEWDRIQPRSV
jgi:hypothetical protein